MDLAFRTPTACVAEAPLQQLLQAIQGPIRQRGGDNPPLRCALRGGEQDVLLQESGLQPFPKDFLVHGDMVDQPAMADSIKARFDVPLQDPVRSGWTPE